MNKELFILYQKYFEILDKQHFDPSQLDYGILDLHIPFLKQLNVLKGSSVSIFDLYQRKHVYLSSAYTSLLGWDVETASKEEGTEYFDRRTHPEDLGKLLEAGTHFMELSLYLSPDVKKDYKFISDYRVQNEAGDYVRVIEQTMALELDPLGNVWLGLSILDLSPDNDLESSTRCRVVNMKTGEVFLFPPEQEIPSYRPELSKREKEILRLIASGMISKEIADALYISVNTVNTHRQRIIEKLNVSNTFEALNYAGRLGIIPGSQATGIRGQK